MKPIDRFGPDVPRIRFLAPDGISRYATVLGFTSALEHLFRNDRTSSHVSAIQTNLAGWMDGMGVPPLDSKWIAGEFDFMTKTARRVVGGTPAPLSATGRAPQTCVDSGIDGGDLGLYLLEP